MLTIKGTDKYGNSIAGLSLLVVCISGVMYWWKRDGIWAYIIMIVFFEAAFLSLRFTREITVTASEMIIDYYRWGLKQRKVFLLAEAVMVIKERVNSRGRKEPLIIISINGKKVYTITDNGGFDKNDFELVLAFIKQENKQSQAL